MNLIFVLWRYIFFLWYAQSAQMVSVSRWDFCWAEVTTTLWTSQGIGISKPDISGSVRTVSLMDAYFVLPKKKKWFESVDDVTKIVHPAMWL
jgi:hypothetical protein